MRRMQPQRLVQTRERVRQAEGTRRHANRGPSATQPDARTTTPRQARWMRGTERDNSSLDGCDRLQIALARLHRDMTSSEAGSAARVATAHSYADRSLSSLSARLAQLQKYSAEYASLRSRIQTLPLKTRHEIMVPLGPLAFQPGFMHHTNEFTVLLGDNLFVERSASECEAIILRRREFVEAQITRVREQMDNIRNVSQTQKKMFGAGAKPAAAAPAAKPAAAASSSSASAPKVPRSILDSEDVDDFDDVSAPAAASSSTAVPAASADGDDDDGDPNAPLDPALLGIRMRGDGKLVNEDGEEIVEIKEEYHSDDDEEHQTSAASASSSPATAPAPASAASPSSAESLQFPSSMLDKDFDQFWSELETMEQKEEAAAAATTAAPTPARAPVAATAAAPAATSSPSSSADSLEPIPSPPLRPITSPADIFHHMQLARIKAGEEKPPESPQAAVRKPAAAPVPAAKSKPAVAAKPAVTTSRSLDAAFAEYKQSPQYAADVREQDEAAARTEAQARRSMMAPVTAAAKAPTTGAKKSVSFGGAEDDSAARGPATAQARKPIIKAAPAPQPTQPTQPQPIARSAPPAATAAVPLTTAEGAAFTGEIQERGVGAARPVAMGKPATAASGPRPMMQPPRPMARPMAAAPSASAASASSSSDPPVKMSKFKAKMLGLDPDDY